MRLSGGCGTSLGSMGEPAGAVGMGGRTHSLLSRLTTLSRSSSRRSSRNSTSRKNSKSNNQCVSSQRNLHLASGVQEAQEAVEGNVVEQEGGLGVKNLLQWAVGVVHKFRTPWLETPPLSC